MCEYANWILSSEKSISIGIFGTLSNWHLIQWQQEKKKWKPSGNYSTFWMNSG